MIDEKGYLHIMTRMDDVINTAGHRLSTGRLEEVVNDHEKVVESAVIGFDHDVRGEVPLAFVILKGSSGCENLTQDERDNLAKEINGKVRQDVGAFARLEGVLFLNKLPKTRSGKILRGTIRKISNVQAYNYPATIDDHSSLEVVTDLVKGYREKTGQVKADAEMPKPTEMPCSQKKEGEEKAQHTNGEVEVEVEQEKQPESKEEPKVISQPHLNGNGEQAPAKENSQPKQPEAQTDEMKEIKKDRAAKRK